MMTRVSEAPAARSRARRPTGRARARRIAVAALLLVAAGGSAGCEGLLDVELPGNVTAATLDNAGIANTLAVSAVSAFECAFANYVNEVALLTDEFHHSSGWLAVRTWSQRRVLPSTGMLVDDCDSGFGFGSFRTMQTARFLAEDAYARFQGWELEDKELLLATVAAYEGYSLTILGEGYCEMTINGGPLMQPPEVLALAEQRFTTAIGHARAAGAEEILNTALVGRARVRLDLGKLAEAAADARAVPRGFIRWVDRGDEQPSRYNRIWNNNNGERDITVDPSFRNLTWKGVADPRVPVVDDGRVGNDQATPLWLQMKYGSRAAPIPLATWEEAQLILAEAEGGATAVAAINALHESAGLPPFDPAADGDIMAHVHEERRRELWVEGHRLNDMLRLGIPFAQGVDHTNQPYGPTTCLPLPQTERNGNPNL